MSEFKKRAGGMRRLRIWSAVTRATLLGSAAATFCLSIQTLTESTHWTWLAATAGPILISIYHVGWMRGHNRRSEIADAAHAKRLDRLHRDLRETQLRTYLH